MKKILTTLMAMLALFTLVACSKGNDKEFPGQWYSCTGI